MQNILTQLGKLQLAAVRALAFLSCSLLAALFCIIIYDVAVRTSGFGSPAWTAATASYSLLYIAMSAAPYLVRHSGHVFVEVLTSKLPLRVAAPLEKTVYAACLALCVIFAWLAAVITFDNWQRGDEDLRAIAIPLWLQSAPLPVGFGMMAIEFLRYLLGRDSMYNRAPAPSGSSGP